MLASIFCPVPHKERMRAVICIAATVHLYVIRVMREFHFVFFAKLEAIFCVRQAAVEKFDVTWMKCWIKFVVAWMRQNQHSALFHHWLVAIHVEEVARSHDLNKDWVENRIHV